MLSLTNFQSSVAEEFQKENLVLFERHIIHSLLSRLTRLMNKLNKKYVKGDRGAVGFCVRCQVQRY